jgi:anti-sigma28 factor (negative regulator of flagellin synthesis)
MPHNTPVRGDVEGLARQMRVQELRRQVAEGTYKVHPQRLALRILVKAVHNKT